MKQTPYEGVIYRTIGMCIYMFNLGLMVTLQVATILSAPEEANVMGVVWLVNCFIVALLWGFFHERRLFMVHLKKLAGKDDE